MNAIKYFINAVQRRKEPFYAKYLSGKKVLDVGSGRGEFLEKEPHLFVGVELDSRLVDLCRNRGLEVHRMDVLHLDFAAESFEAVRAAQIIEHFTPEDAVQFLREAERVLVPGGIIFITTPGVRNVWNTFSHVRPYPPFAFVKLLGSETENYLRQSPLRLRLEGFWGSRCYFKSRWLSLLSRLFDLLFPPDDPIGWTIILRKKQG